MKSPFLPARRVAVVTNCIPVYRYPVFQRLAASGQNQWQFFLSLPPQHSCEDARNNLPLHFTFGFNPWFKSTHSHVRSVQREQLSIPISLVADLLKFRPDLIISGDFGLRSLACWFVGRLLSVPVVIWSEEIATSAKGRTKPQQWLRRFLIPRAAAFLAWGAPAENYLRSMSVAPEKIHRCCQAVDNDFWITQSRQLDRDMVRRQLGFKGTVFLLVGRLVERKGFRNFLNAWQGLSSNAKARSMAVIVGSGEQNDELRQLAGDAHMHNVVFAGPQSSAKLVSYYVAADVLVFPSLEDVWGMVVNEALCCGLPVIASKYAGASQELVADRGTGSVIDPVDVEGFTRCLEAWSDTTPSVLSDHCRTVAMTVNQETSVKEIAKLLRRPASLGLLGASPLTTGD